VETKTGLWTDAFRSFPEDSRSMNLLQILSAVVIVGGVVITALIAIIPTVVDR
jgi:uncharacterized membrane protein YdcZ (DUF606 family)